MTNLVLPLQNLVHYEGCTKFCEGCAKGSKVHSKVGIGPQSLSYGFLNEIMDHPCSNEGPRSDRMRCTKFNEGCTKFCEGCTKCSKVRSKMGIDPQSLPYGFQNEIMNHPCSDGGPESNRFGCTKFCEGCTKGSKMLFEVGIGPQSLPYGFLNEIMDHPCSDGGPRSDRIGCTKFNDVPNFVKDVPRVPKCVSRWRSAPNHFFVGF